MSSGQPLNFLIAGGTGFIGSNVALHLARTGSGNITFVSRQSKLPKHLKGTGSLMTWQELEKNGIPSGTDVVMCLTGNNFLNPLSMLRKKKLVNDARASRIIPAQTMSALIKKCQIPPKMFIVASATSAYPLKRSYNHLYFSDYDTDHEPEGFLAGITQDIEKVSIIPKNHKTRTILPRFGVVLGHESRYIKTQKFMYLMQSGLCMGDSDKYFHWIHIDDVVQSLMYLIYLNLLLKDNDPKLKTVTGPINFVTNPNVETTNKSFAETIGESMSREILLHVPTQILKLLMHKDIADQLSMENRIFPEKLLDMGYEFKFNQAGDALDDVLHTA